MLKGLRTPHHSMRFGSCGPSDFFRSFVSDTAPQCSDREGRGRPCTGTTQWRIQGGPEPPPLIFRPLLLPLLGKPGLLLYTALYLGLGPQFASGFSWYLSSFFCLEAGLAPGFASNDTCITGSLLRMAAPGEFSFFRFTGLSFSQHLMMSQTTSEDNHITSNT